MFRVCKMGNKPAGGWPCFENRRDVLKPRLGIVISVARVLACGLSGLESKSIGPVELIWKVSRALQQGIGFEYLALLLSPPAPSLASC